MHVLLNPPCLDGDTIWFTWTDNTGLPAPPEGGLFYRYEDLDLTVFSHELWMEIFLALRLRAYRDLPGQVSLQLPFAVPPPVIDFWRTYHGADNVHIGPVATGDSYSPWRKESPSPRQKSKAAMFLGGGRDSLSTACMLGEVFGRDNVLLIQCVDPHQGAIERRDQIAKRYAKYSLDRVREKLGFQTQRVWTNLHAIALEEGGLHAEPHLEQYTAGHLPVLLASDAPTSSFGYPWGEYLILERPAGTVFRYDLSRPEILQAQARHYERIAGIRHTPVNINLAVNGVISFTLLAKRYPDAFPHILSCQASKQKHRWCHHCPKCARYAMSCLQEGVDPVDFDLNRFFAISTWVHAVLASTKGVDAPPPGENAAWRPGWCASGAYQGYCAAFYHADVAFAAERMQSTAFYNFLTAKSMYGNRDHQINHVSPAEAYTWMPPSLAGPIGEIVTTVANIEPLSNRRIEVGDGSVAFGPFARPFNHPLLELPHLRQDVVV